jgi:hypothetical protein
MKAKPGRNEIKAGTEGNQSRPEGFQRPTDGTFTECFHVFSICSWANRSFFVRYASGHARVSFRAGSFARRVRWLSRRASLVGGKAGSAAIEFIEQPLARRGVIEGLPHSGLAIAVDSLEHLEQWVDRGRPVFGRLRFPNATDRTPKYSTEARADYFTRPLCMPGICFTASYGGRARLLHIFSAHLNSPAS